MNQTQSPEIVQKFALEGPLSTWQLIALGGVIAVIIGFFAWRDYKAAGSRRLLALLILPRLAALAVALWMLAGPSETTMSRQYKSKSVVVMIDGSGSMGLVDAVDGSGNTVRWDAAQDAPALATVDQALGSLRSAGLAVERIRQANKNADQRQQAQAIWEQARDGVGSAATQLSHVTLDAARTDSDSRAELGRVASYLQEGLGRVAGSKLSGATSRQALEDRLDELGSFIEGGARRLERLSQKISAAYEQNAPAREKQALDNQSKLSREDKVISWLDGAESSWLKELGSKARILRYKFAANVLPVADTDWHGALVVQTNLNLKGTDIGAALSQAVQDAGEQPVDAAILVTDGGQNMPDDPRDAATSLHGVPLIVVPIGSTVVPRDVILHHLQCPRAVFKKDTVVIDAMVTAYYCQNEQVRVELVSDDAVVDSQNILISSAVFDGRVSFRWKAADLGRHVLKVRAVPLPREHSLNNNEAQTEVEVMEDTIRVLVADNLPRWEFRYLSMLFKRDKHVDFEQLLFEPNDDSESTGEVTLPRDAAGWRHYRVVILGDLSPAELSVPQQELLRKYVAEDGGNLIVIAGETSMPEAFAGQPLGNMIPATAAPVDANQAYSLAVTAEGSTAVPTQLDDDPLASERIWREMSTRLPVYNLSPVSRPKATAHRLIAATNPDQPAEQRDFLSWQYVGLGRVIYIAAPITYQLRYGIGDLYHHRFWGQLLRWAVAREMTGGSKTIHLLSDKNRYEVGDHAQIALRLNGTDGAPVPGAQCHVEAMQEGQVIKMIELHEDAGAPGNYRGTFTGLPAGQITLRAAGSTVQTLMAAENRSEPVDQFINVDIKGTTEASDPICNLPLLNQIADASGGMLLPPDSVQNALAHLDLAPESQDSVLSRRPLWDNWYFLWIFIGCLTIEWLARRYWRML